MSRSKQKNKIDLSLAGYQRPKLNTPKGQQKLLLHSCCAPCAGDIMQALQASNINTTLFFYNPNIHPISEYELRKQENIRFARKVGMPFIDADYDSDNWFERIKGQENEPERGKRCTTCFDMRFERTALYANEHGYDLISSTLGISRWKDMTQINTCGINSTNAYPSIDYWTFNWRKQGGSSRMVELAKQEEFYQQEYCGCVYSLRDTNLWRAKNSQDKIERGTKFYQQALKKIS